jgi:hypothetical protein
MIPIISKQYRHVEIRSVKLSNDEYKTHSMRDFDVRCLCLL